MSFLLDLAARVARQQPGSSDAIPVAFAANFSPPFLRALLLFLRLLTRRLVSVARQTSRSNKFYLMASRCNARDCGTLHLGRANTCFELIDRFQGPVAPTLTSVGHPFRNHSRQSERCLWIEQEN